MLIIYFSLSFFLLLLIYKSLEVNLPIYSLGNISQCDCTEFEELFIEPAMDIVTLELCISSVLGKRQNFYLYKG